MARKYDSTVARIAGNIASGMVGSPLFASEEEPQNLATAAVKLARLVVAETLRTEVPEEAK